MQKYETELALKETAVRINYRAYIAEPVLGMFTLESRLSENHGAWKGNQEGMERFE